MWLDEITVKKKKIAILTLLGILNCLELEARQTSFKKFVVMDISLTSIKHTCV